VGGPTAWGLGEVLTTPRRKHLTVLPKGHKNLLTVCQLLRKPVFPGISESVHSGG
jgi:hypothetical protein